jgi:hypothetical protein
VEKVAACPACPSAHVIERGLAGGFPEALTQSDPIRRRALVINYARSLASQDVLDIAGLTEAGMMRGLTDHAAVMIGKLFDLSDLGQGVDFLTKTIDRWILLIENVCLLARVRLWHRGEIDEGVISLDRTVLGPVLECFACNQSRKARGLTADSIRIGFYKSRLSFKWRGVRKFRARSPEMKPRRRGWPLPGALRPQPQGKTGFQTAIED